MAPAFKKLLDAERKLVLSKSISTPAGHDPRWQTTGVRTNTGADIIDLRYWLVEAFNAAGKRIDLWRGIKAIQNTSKDLPGSEYNLWRRRLAVAWAKEFHNVDIEEVKRIWNSNPDYSGRLVTVGTIWHVAVKSGWDPPRPPWHEQIINELDAPTSITKVTVHA